MQRKRVRSLCILGLWLFALPLSVVGLLLLGADLIAAVTIAIVLITVLVGLMRSRSLELFRLLIGIVPMAALAFFLYMYLEEAWKFEIWHLLVVVVTIPLVWIFAPARDPDQPESTIQSPQPRPYNASIKEDRKRPELPDATAGD